MESLRNIFRCMYARKVDFLETHTHLTKSQRLENGSWTMPPQLAASLTKFQKNCDQIAQDAQDKATIKNIQTLIRVRNGPLFVLLICVRHLFYLSSHWYHLAANRTLLQGPQALKLALLANPDQVMQSQEHSQVKRGQQQGTTPHLDELTRLLGV